MASHSRSKKSIIFHHSDHYLHFHQDNPSGDNYLFALELEESDVVWGQSDSHSEVPSSPLSSPRVGAGMIPPAIKKKKKKKLEKPAVSASLPVNVPHWSRVRQLRECDGDEEVDAATSMTEKLPPHEYLARRRRGDSFPVPEGLGRALKGMELCRVRNQILKKIVGFED